MELEEFKNDFEKNLSVQELTAAEIQSAIYRDAKSPLLTYRKNLRLSIFIFSVASILFLVGVIFHIDFRQHLSMWLLFAILFIEFVFACYNHIIVEKILRTQGSVRQSLMNKIYIMEKLNRWYLSLHVLLFGVMALFLEYSLTQHSDVRFEGWARVPFSLRLMVYVFFLCFSFFTKKASQKKLYGNFLRQLKGLARQL